MRPTPLPICINVSCVSVTAELQLSESGNKRGEQKYEGRESPLWQYGASLPFGPCRWDRVGIAAATAAVVWSQPFCPFRRVRPYSP